MTRLPDGRGCRGREGGVALLLAVWLLALLGVVVGEFVFSTRVRAAAERNKRDDLRAWSLAIAGYRAALAALDAEITGLSLDADDGLLLHYRRGSAGTPGAAKDVPLGDGSYSWRIVSEDGLVSVNVADKRSVFVELLKACGMGPGAERDTVIDSIIDWRDVNPNHRLNGAEEDYYRGLEPPYSCKDRPLDVLEELLLVRGVTPELFYGRKEGDRVVPGLRDLLSVYALDANPNAAIAPKAVREALRLPAPKGPIAPGGHYRIIATGDPGGGAPARSVQAIVRREGPGAGGTWTFTLLYWNEFISPEPVGREGDT